MSEAQIYQSPGATNPRPGDEKASTQKKNACWWRAPEEDRAAIVAGISQRIFRQNIGRHEDYRRWMRMYNNMLGRMWSPALAGIDRTGGGQRLSLNVIKSCSDTFTSKMTLERPKCTFLTSGGDWSLQNKAKDLEKFVDGQFYEMKLYEDAPSVVLDACVYGDGAYKILVDGDLRDEESAKYAKVIGERTPIWSLGVDTRDAIVGKPRTMVQHKMVDRGVLCALFPKKEKEIQEATPPEMGEERNFPMWMIADDTTSDMIQLNMIWHLPSSPLANDGWYWIGTDNCQLDMQPWPHDYFPFAFYRRMPPLAGFYAIGIAEEGRGIQQDLNMIWHLPSSPLANDGWYWIGTDNCQLDMQPWMHNYFPFAFYKRMPPLAGFYAVGVAEELRGIQQDINMMIQKAQAAIHLMATPKWWLQGTGAVPPGILGNDITIVRGMIKPEVMVPGGVLPADFWQHLERQYQRAFELTGINQMQAMAQKPAGLNSGKAQDTYIDIVSERFAVASRNYHDFVLEVGRQVIDRARDITKVYKKYAVISISKSTSQSVEFLKVDLSKEQAVLQMYPTNKLSKDPAERMAQVEQLVNAGMVDPNDAPRLLEFPDLQQEWNLKYASYEVCMWMIDSILNEGVVIQPVPFMNFAEAKKWGTLKLLVATRCKAPESHLQMLREWIQTVDQMEQEAMPKPAPAAPPGMAPPGMPPPGAPPGMPPDAGMPPPEMSGAPPMAA